ncbi:MAG TPA: hypothetical protein VE912_13920 [Bacteroidales bacterium]|nr:hypothetical protein [Bacteroidales bacterium]
MRNYLFKILLFSVIIFSAVLQTFSNDSLFFRELELSIDTSTYYFTKDTIQFQQRTQLGFQYSQNTETCEVRIYPKSSMLIEDLALLPSSGFDILDSVLNVNNAYYRFRVRFKDLTNAEFLSFNLSVKEKGDTASHINVVNLFPYTTTQAGIFPADDELFIGEEKTFDLVTDNPENIKLLTDWVQTDNFDYRLTALNGQIKVHVLPRKLGRQVLELRLNTRRPFLNSNGSPVFDLPVISHSFSVKQSRLVFLNIDKGEVTLDDQTRMAGIEVQLDDYPSLQIGKTYRIEAQEKPGGALIAELFTRSKITNNRVLCQLRVYNYHRKSGGYLYIKDGDEAKFITNFSITPKTAITKISILHEGVDWTQNLDVHPGETVDIKIEGEALHKAKFHFEDVKDVSTDSLIRNENMVIYKIRIPIDITKKKIQLYNRSAITGYALNVVEYQRPRPFDYILVNYGDINRNLASLKSPVLYKHTVKDVFFNFVPNRIDDQGQLYGKQYLSIEIKITGSNGQLIEMKTIDNLVVCPGENSPRYQYYDRKNCVNDAISLNSYLSKKTYDLEDWAKIELTVKTRDDKYDGEEITKKLDIILQKTYSFDIDVSFPAGLITYKTKPDEFGGLGVSMAMIAQFSFYNPNKIAKLRPYKVGAGFVALNAFNLSENNTSRDLGIVILGSILPVKSGSKLSFPLYLGGGYLVSEKTWFWLIGPGIRVQL